MYVLFEIENAIKLFALSTQTHHWLQLRREIGNRKQPAAAHGIRFNDTVEKVFGQGEQSLRAKAKAR